MTKEITLNINRFDFAALCSERTVDPGIAYEQLNEIGYKIKFTTETTKATYNKMIKILNEEF